MVNFVRNFKNYFKGVVSLVIVAVLAALAVYQAVSGVNGFFPIFTSFLPIFLIAAAAIWLEFKGKSFPAHLVLLLGPYANYGSQFFRALLSFRLQPEIGWETSPLDFQLIIGLLAFLYLLLFVISSLFDGAGKTKLVSSPVWLPIFLVFAFLYLTGSLSAAIIGVMPAFAALLFASPLAAGLLLLASVVSVPFDAIDLILNGSLGQVPFSYWIFVLFSIFIIFLTVKVLAKTKE